MASEQLILGGLRRLQLLSAAANRCVLRRQIRGDGWVAAEDYMRAPPNPLAAVAPSISAHMNADHVDAMILLARVHARLEASKATMTSVDRLGFS